MLSYAKSAIARPGDRLNGFKNGKTLGELENEPIFKKKWSVPLRAAQTKDYNYKVYIIVLIL